MSVYKVGNNWVVEFEFKKKRYRESTHQDNYKVALRMERDAKSKLAMGAKGIKDKETPVTLGEFITDRFQPWAKAQFEHTSPKTWRSWYRYNLQAVLAYEPLASKPLDQITSEDTAAFGAFRHSAGLQVSSVNATLRVLRRALRVAVEWGVVPSYPKIKLLRGERHRERVISPAEQAKYLAACSGLLFDISTVLFETGFRPDECYRLMWENIRWESPKAKCGTISNGFGKTKAARRLLPMTATVRTVLETRWERAGKPVEGFVFPAETKTGHVESSTVSRHHDKTFEAIAASAETPVKKFVLYAIRHTFLTRLGQSGCDAWTLARIAGHSSIVMGQRYVHPDHSAVMDAMDKFAGPPENPPTDGPKRLN